VRRHRLEQETTVGFPITARYKVSFRHSDTGLSPIFTRFRTLDTLQAILPQPSFVELGSGDYYFEFTWLTKNDPDIEYEVDGGDSIPTEVVRYVSSVISVRAFVTSATASGGGGSSSFSVG
jgi:hypothetical protein